jgi:hypothetical protein
MNNTINFNKKPEIFACNLRKMKNIRRVDCTPVKLELVLQNHMRYEQMELNHFSKNLGPNNSPLHLERFDGRTNFDVNDRSHKSVSSSNG